MIIKIFVSGASFKPIFNIVLVIHKNGTTEQSKFACLFLNLNYVLT